MRVEIVEASASVGKGSASEATTAGENRALNGFLAAVNASDSFFRAAQTSSAFSAPAEEEGVQSYRLTFRIKFSREEFNQNRGLYFTLVEKMAELLGEAGAAESLGVRLAIDSLAGDAGGRTSHSLILELAAKGGTPEQAELRWGLGIAHVQKALLFTSRQLRQEISSRGD